MHGPIALSRLKRIVLRGLATALAASGLLLGVGPAPHALAASQIACSGGGGVTIDKQLDGTFKWVLSGVATCNDPAGDPVRQAALTGLATTPNLGFCTNDALVNAFSMNVAVTWTSFSPTRGVVNSLQHQVWALPETTFPVITEFGIRELGGAQLGEGEISTHIFGKCPPDGEPSMQVAWTQYA
jgi:hypothetical protein